MPLHRPGGFLPFIARLRAILVLLLIGILGGFLTPAHAVLSWRPGEGWTDEKGGQASASSSRDQLALAKKLEAQGDIKGSYQAYRALVRRWPLSFFASEAQFRSGKLEERRGDFWRAFKSYQKMVEKYPASEFFDQALERQFAIGNLYLAGEKEKLWKIPIAPATEKAAQAFEQVIKNAPYGKLAPQAQFAIGLTRERQGKYSLAVAAYTALIDRYPGHDLVDDAQYQIGFAWLRASSQPEYDQSAAQKAIEAFEDFLVRYPGSEKAAQAKEHIGMLANRQTQGAFTIAQFYERQKNYAAAAIYYNEVIRQQPNSKQAQDAKKRLADLKPALEGKKEAPLLKPGELAGPAPEVAAVQDVSADAPEVKDAADGGPTSPEEKLPEPTSAPDPVASTETEAPQAAEASAEATPAPASAPVTTTAVPPPPPEPPPAPKLPTPPPAGPDGIPPMPWASGDPTAMKTATAPAKAAASSSEKKAEPKAAQSESKKKTSGSQKKTSSKKKPAPKKKSVRDEDDVLPRRKASTDDE